jgi:hypothetical protein
VVAFVESLRRELAALPGLRQAAGYRLRSRSGSIQGHGVRTVTNAPSVERRRTAIEAAIRAAEQISLESLEPDVLVRRLALLRQGLPPAEDVHALAEAARRRDQAAIDSAA